MENKYGKYDFVGKAKLMLSLSFLTLVLATGFIWFKGLNYGIDFAGGTEIQVKFASEVSATEMRNFVTESGHTGASVQAFGDTNEFLIRIQADDTLNEKEQNTATTKAVSDLTTALATKFPTQGPEIRRVDSVGPQVGSQLKQNALLAIFYSLLIILIYIGFRFDYEYAPGAVFSLFHDVVIVLGIYCLMGREVSVQTLAAILTVIGYSLNDTIVNFDRIRENIEKQKGMPIKGIVNLSINEMLNRTLLTSTTTLMSCAALYFIAGGVIADFAIILALGIVIGTFSSIYVAAPSVMYFFKFKKR